MSKYFPEIHKGQTYLIEGTRFELTDISIANIEAKDDYIIVLAFKNETEFFTIAATKIIDNPDYELIEQGFNEVEVRQLFQHCNVLTVGKKYEVLGFKHKYEGTRHQKKLFKIEDDNGKKRWYLTTNSMFKLL